jgi:hypothetical protein
VEEDDIEKKKREKEEADQEKEDRAKWLEFIDEKKKEMDLNLANQMEEPGQSSSPEEDPSLTMADIIRLKKKKRGFQEDGKKREMCSQSKKQKRTILDLFEKEKDQYVPSGWTDWWVWVTECPGKANKNECFESDKTWENYNQPCGNCKRLERVEIGKKMKDYILNRVMSRQIVHEWLEISWQEIDSRRMEKEAKRTKRLELAARKKERVNFLPQGWTEWWSWTTKCPGKSTLKECLNFLEDGNAACQNCKKLERLESGKKMKQYILNRVMSRKIGYEWLDNIWLVIESRRMERELKKEKRLNLAARLRDGVRFLPQGWCDWWGWTTRCPGKSKPGECLDYDDGSRCDNCKRMERLEAGRSLERPERTVEIVTPKIPQGRKIVIVTRKKSELTNKVENAVLTLKDKASNFESGETEILKTEKHKIEPIHGGNDKHLKKCRF